MNSHLILCSQGSTPYKLMRRVSYPFQRTNENTIKEQTIYDKLRHFIVEVSSNNKYIVDDNIEIPLNIIMPCVSNCCSSIEELEFVYFKLYNVN